MSLSKEEKSEIEKLIQAELKKTIDFAIHQFNSLSKQGALANLRPEDISKLLLEMIKDGITA